MVASQDCQENSSPEVERIYTDVVFEVLMSKYKYPVGLRIHVIPKAGAAGVAPRPAEFRRRVNDIIAELLRNNHSFRSRRLPHATHEYDGDAFRHEFVTVETVLNTYSQLAQLPSDEADIVNLLSLEQDLANSRQEVCKPQADLSCYKTASDAAFPFPPLAVSFDSDSIHPQRLTRPMLLFRMEAVVTLHDFPTNVWRPMTGNEVLQVQRAAGQKTVDARVGRCGLDGRTANATPEERMAEVSIIEYYRRERGRCREHYKNDEAVAADLEKEMCANFLERLLKIDSDGQFNNEAMSGVAQHLRSVEDIFDVGTLAVSDDLTPFGNFLVVLAGCVSELWGGTPGQKQQMLLSIFFGSLTAFDVTDPTQNLVLQHLGEAGIGKSFCSKLACKLIPPGVHQVLGYESKHAETMHSHDRDGSTIVYDESPKEMLDSTNFPELARFFRIGVTNGAMPVARALSQDGVRGKENVMITMSTFILILTNEPIPPNDAMQSRVTNMEFERHARANRREVLRQALSNAGVLDENDKSFMVFHTIFSVAALYLVMQSAGFFPPTPNRVLCDVLLHIDQEMSKQFDLTSSFVRTPLRVKMLANAMAVVKGVVTVLASPLRHTLYAGLRGKPMLELLNAVQAHVFADAQVSLAVISLFDRTIMSEEQALVRRALLTVPGTTELLGHVPRKYVDSIDVLVEALAESTGLDRERLKSVVKDFRKKNATLRVQGKNQQVPIIKLEGPRSNQRVGILDTNFMRTCDAVRAAALELDSASRALLPAQSCQTTHGTGLYPIQRYLPVRDLADCLMRRLGLQEAAVRENLNALKEQQLIWQNETGSITVANRLMQIEPQPDERELQCNSPVDLAVEFMSTPKTLPRPLVLVTNVLAKAEDGQMILCPQLATVYLQRSQEVSPSYSVTHRSYYGNFLGAMLDAKLHDTGAHSSDNGYVDDIDTCAMDEAAKIYGIEPRSELFSLLTTVMCVAAREQELLLADAGGAYCQKGQYPRKLVERYVEETLLDEARTTARKQVTLTGGEDLMNIYSSYGVLLDHAGDLLRNSTDQDTRVLALPAGPAADDAQPSSAAQESE